MPQQPRREAQIRPGTAARARSVSSRPPERLLVAVRVHDRGAPRPAKRRRPDAARSATRARAERAAAATAATRRRRAADGASRRSAIAWQLGSTKAIGGRPDACVVERVTAGRHAPARHVDHGRPRARCVRSSRRPRTAGVPPAGPQQAQQRLADLRLLMLDEAVGEQDDIGPSGVRRPARASGGRAPAGHESPAVRSGGRQRDATSAVTQRRAAAARVDAGPCGMSGAGQRPAPQRVDERREPAPPGAAGGAGRPTPRARAGTPSRAAPRRATRP